jgi:hypothetical protein
VAGLEGAVDGAQHGGALRVGLALVVGESLTRCGTHWLGQIERPTSGSRSGRIRSGRSRSLGRGARRGELWLAQVGRKKRPVLILTRSEVIDVRELVTVAEVTTSVRGLAA